MRLRVLGIGIWHIKHVSVLERSLIKLRLEILELHRRDQEADLPVAVVVRFFVALVVNRCYDYRIHGENCQFFHSQNVELAPENDLGDRVNVVAKILVEQKSFRHLEVVQML